MKSEGNAYFFKSGGWPDLLMVKSWEERTTENDEDEDEEQDSGVQNPPLHPKP